MIKRILWVLAFTILASGMASSQSPGKWRSYYNKEFKVGLKYPPGWELDDAKRPLEEETGFTALAEVSPRENSYPGEQLHEAKATIAVATVSEAACKLFPPSPDGETKPVRKKIGNLTFYMASNGDAGAGSVGESDIYRAFHDSRCYEITLMVYRRNVPKPDRGVRMVNIDLDAILHTFYFGK